MLVRREWWRLFTHFFRSDLEDDHPGPQQRYNFESQVFSSVIDTHWSGGSALNLFLVNCTFSCFTRTRMTKNEFRSLLIFRSVDSLPNLRSGKLLRGIFREDEKAWCCLPCLPVSILPECVWWPSLICPCVGVDCLPSYFRRKTSCARLLEDYTS